MFDSFVTGIIFPIIAAYAVILIFYLRAETKNGGKAGFRRATAIKLTLSAIFCGTGVLSCLITNMQGTPMMPRILILSGLFAAFAGDYFLQFIRLDTQKYKTGIVCFMAAQALFIAGLITLHYANISGWTAAVILTVILLLIILAIMKKQGWNLGGEKNVLSLYTVLLSFMTAYAVANSFGAGAAVPGAALMAAGAILFWISDLFLGLWNYHTGKRLHANLNWISYFSGTLLIALSILPLF